MGIMMGAARPGDSCEGRHVIISELRVRCSVRQCAAWKGRMKSQSVSQGCMEGHAGIC